MYNLPTLPSPSFLQNFCCVVKLTEYLAEACHRQLLLAKTSVAASTYVYLGVVFLFVFVL
jgi:hypothetical protein